VSRPRFARRVRGRRALTLAFAPRLIIQLSGGCQILTSTNRAPRRFEPLCVRVVKGLCIVATEAEDCISFPVPQNRKLDDFRGTRIGVELVTDVLARSGSHGGHGAGALHGKTVLGDDDPTLR
jgi:hypothetical protein